MVRLKFVVRPSYIYIYIYIYILYIYIYIIYISSCRAGSTDIPDPLSPLFPIVHRPRHVLQDNIPYPHIVAECMFVLVVLLLHAHVWGSIRVHHLFSRRSSLSYHIYHPSARAGYDTRSIFKRSLTGLNSQFSLS